MGKIQALMLKMVVNIVTSVPLDDASLDVRFAFGMYSITL